MQTVTGHTNLTGEPALQRVVRARTWKDYVGRCLVIPAAVLVLNSAQGGTITGVAETTGTVNGVLLFSNQPNNDNSANAGGQNAFGVDEIIFDVSAPIDIVLNVADSGGTTEYSAFASIFNFSPDTWNGFEISIGNGVGASFRAIGAATGLDFDTPDIDPLPGSVLFPFLTVNETRLIFDNGTAPFGWVDATNFSIDVPDGITRFTLRFAPVIDSRQVSIDIDPRSSLNEITNPDGWMYVAVLTTSTTDGDSTDFNAQDILPESVTFGPNDASMPGQPRMLDVDNDADLDLVLRFRTRSTGIVCGDTDARLSAVTVGGEIVSGVDVIRTTGCDKQDRQP